MFMGMYHGVNYGAIKWACVILSELLSLLYDLTLLLSSQNAFNDVESSLTDIPSNQFDLWHDYHQKLHIDCGPRGPPRSTLPPPHRLPEIPILSSSVSHPSQNF